MPRGIPNAKRDETGLRYTSFHVPLAPNPKHLGSAYLKSDAQTIWARNAARAHATKSKPQTDDTAAPTIEGRRGSQVIVIHPGSRYLRIGKASDVTPVTIPNVIARKHQAPVPIVPFVEGITRPRKSRLLSQRSPPALPPGADEYAVARVSDDPFEEKLAAITVSLRERMKFYKLRVTPTAASIASTFNEQFKPETIPEENDPFRVRWIMDPPQEQVLVGDNVLRLSDPQRLGYAVRWPIYGTRFNTRDYPSPQMILDDIETILRVTLNEKFNLDSQSFKDYSVVLVIPDFYERAYVHDLINILFVSMGFKQLTVQQESLAATYGAGISSACVVDIGAVTTSIACVDEGMVIPDTRMSLNMGGNDITEFLYILLDRICFPYRDCNLSRSYDWGVMEDLKARLCTLAEGDVALNLYDFVVRRPAKPAEKYGLRAYDEIILAPMCIFEPRVVEFDRKRVGMHPTNHPDVTDEMVDHPADHVSQAMLISTQHLLPHPVPVVIEPPPSISASPSKGSTTAPPSVADTDAASVSDKPPAQSVPSEAPSTSTSTPTPNPIGDNPMDVDGAETDAAKAKAKSAPGSAKQVAPTPAPAPMFQPTYPGGFAIDVCFEASKLPLDVAIFNSARAAGGDEKIRKYLQAVLVVGGSALVPGMGHALESRLQAISTPLVPNMEKVQIIPPPKDVDPRVLAWKGAAVLGKMDGVADLWLTPSDWDVMGMRGLKERCFYL
ncbi:hypothetical protein JAAARDRAFT_203897 [Jaapia argillacea MUCL 33604]|uniref:Uncharacterized protein n=1 Tax=Jaapia argillacea MUCL 33604 TaxID=933084 RepID=A0A067QCX7_9AGAM|nr:hypothetical protein JAAARDRAFT_203897 [Jaapia argillacea MUCL 33604]